ncbi:MAG: hypothetical protein KF901_15535 [Myxococcales bacterium]|nr:hypothetical protein [Myxococcales bacterium]
MGLVLVALAGLVLLLIVGGVVLAIAKRSGATSPSREGPSPSHEGPAPTQKSPEVIFFLRFEGQDDEAYVRELASRHAHIGGASQAREAALDLVRAAPTATHAYCGPASAAPHGPGVAHSGLPGGLIVGFVARGRRPLDTADGRDLAAVVAELRKVSGWVDGDFAGAELRLAQASVDAPAPALSAVRKETRPGHQLCRYCDHAFLAHDTRCPNCGARAER